MASSEKQPTLMSPVGIVSYPALAKPKKNTNVKGRDADPNKKPRYEIVLIVTPKLMDQYDAEKWKQVERLKAMKKSALDALCDTFTGGDRDKAKDLIARGKLLWPFKTPEDADEDSPFASYPDGTQWFTAWSYGKPGVCDRYDDGTGKPVEIRSDEDIEEKVYPGCHGRVTLRAFTYENSGNKGVAFFLSNVQKVNEGERIDGRKSASEEFEALADAADLDEEEAPRSRKRAAKDDDDEPAPAKRRAPKVDDDEDDAPPRRRAAKAADDDDEPAPRRGRKASAIDDIL